MCVLLFTMQFHWDESGTDTSPSKIEDSEPEETMPAGDAME